MTLTFNLLTLKMVHNIAHGVGNLPTISLFLGFCFLDLCENTCHTHQGTLEVMAVVGNTGLRSWYSICVPSFKFVGLSFRKIWLTSAHSISQSGDLDLWPLTLKLVRVIARRVGNFPTNFYISRMFCSWHIGQHLSDCQTHHVTLRPWGYGACRWCGSSCFFKFEVRRPSHPKVLRIYCASVNRRSIINIGSRFTIVV